MIHEMFKTALSLFLLWSFFGILGAILFPFYIYRVCSGKPFWFERLYKAWRDKMDHVDDYRIT